MDNTRFENYIIRTGIGHSPNKLTAFDRALIAARVSDYNLIKISSILPPNCTFNDDVMLSGGALLPSAFCTRYSDKIGETISAAVAIGIPRKNDDFGVIMKHSSLLNKIETEEIVRSLAQQAMYDRRIPLLDIVSASTECLVESSEIYCVFATVSLW